MENPREDVKKVIRKLVCRPSLQQQAQAIRTYFTPDCNLYYYYLNVGGRKDLTAIYQLAHLLFNYQTVQFHDVVYDASANAVAVHMTIYIRSLLTLFRESCFVFYTLAELHDHITEDGKRVKLIKEQRDYFDRSPTLTLIPFAGWLYKSVWLRVLFGHVLVLVARSFRGVVSLLYPNVF